MGFEICDVSYLQGLIINYFDRESDKERHGIYWQVLNGETTVKWELLYPSLDFAAQFINIQQTIYMSSMVWLHAFKDTAFFFLQLQIFFYPFNPKSLNNLSSGRSLKADQGAWGRKEMTKDHRIIGLFTLEKTSKITEVTQHCQVATKPCPQMTYPHLKKKF